ncbi:hypothetical protein ABT158_49710 [Nonomuraea sp. NPDC001636]|uniref:hypothetical protein n=1 Tax=Nonomuraea sp. NPDC001636 TaxID=3154391 RepID=UPI003326DD8C
MAAAILLTLTPLAVTIRPWPFAILVLLACGGGLIATWKDDPWPLPVSIDLTRLKTGRSRAKVTFCFAVGLAGGFVAAHTLGLALALACGLLVGLAFGILTGLAADGFCKGFDPRMTLFNDFAAWLGDGCHLAALGLLWSRHAAGLALGLTLGLALGLALGLTTLFERGPVMMRYLMLLITSGLPWRLGRFLHWCNAHAGLLRTAGIAYQFRHRELQDHLATTSVPEAMAGGVQADARR